MQSFTKGFFLYYQASFLHRNTQIALFKIVKIQYNNDSNVMFNIDLENKSQGFVHSSLSH